MPKTGLIGFVCGIIGFVLSFVYVIFNGIVFTSKYSGVPEREKDGYFAERKGNSGTEYNCISSYLEQNPNNRICPIGKEELNSTG